MLKRHSLGETDRVVHVYTREHGKLSAVAKGSRRANSRLTGATEPFTEVSLLLATGRSLDIVTQCEVRQSFPRLRESLDRLARATYICDLLSSLTVERDAAPSAELYDLAVSALHLLQRTPVDLDTVVHAYEVRLLTALGYAPELRTCVRCGREVGAVHAGFSPSLGGVLCASDRFSADDSQRLGPRSLLLLRQLAESEPDELLCLMPEPGPMAEVGKALRWYVRARTERELKSAAFLDEVRAATASGREDGAP